jgi:regulator of sigma E protease
MFSSGLLTLVAFGAMIFIHELGHFLAAKRVGVRVEKFYLGFDFWGLKLFKYVHKGTEYGIGVFPLGGYVKMAGQEDFGKANIDGKSDEFTSKTVGERAQILVAGVLFNFVSAFIFSALALYLGYRLVAPNIGEVQPGSAAWISGIQSGDKVISYDGFPITSFDSLGTEVALGGAGKTVNMVVERNGQKVNLNITPQLNAMEIPTIGVLPSQSMQVMGVIEGSPAEKAGISPGDVIVGVQGEKIERWENLSPKINELVQAGQLEQSIEIKRGQQTLTLKLSPTMEKAPLLGFRPRLGRQVIKVKPNSSLDQAGVRAGMTLVSVNEQAVSDILAIDEKTFKGQNNFTLAFKGPNQTLSVDYVGTWEDLDDSLIFGNVNDLETVVVSRVEPNSEAERMGLQVGDHITALTVEQQGTLSAPSWTQLRHAIAEATGKNVRMDVLREGQALSLTGTVQKTETGRYIIGMMPDYLSAPNEPTTALLMPFHMLRQTYKGLLSLVTGKIAMKHVSGPVGIFKVTYQVASVGTAELVYLMALLSINLAFLNILPIPVLDGGHLLFCFVEWIKGSPLNEKILEKIQYVGFAMLLSLFIFATWNDITQHIL